MNAAPSRKTPWFGSVPSLIFRLFALIVIDAFGLWLIYQMIADGVYPFAAILALVTVMINVVFLYEPLSPIRWIAPGLALMILMALYPVMFTVYTAFTNYSAGHVLSKQQAIDRITQDLYVPEGGRTFSWAGYQAGRSPNGAVSCSISLRAGPSPTSSARHSLSPVRAKTCDRPVSRSIR